MDISNKKINCDDANRIDIVDYLSSLGYQPEKIRGHNYWYLSMLPDRFEKNPSFKVNRNRNQWYDFGKSEGKKGGTLIDFGIQYHKCTVSEFLQILSGPVTIGQTVPRERSIQTKSPEHGLTILQQKPIQSERLLSYLNRRRIPLDVAQNICREVQFQYKDKSYFAVGFKSDAGGYELRNEYFKGSSSPKSITFIDNGADEVTSFEGFFNLLSFLTIHRNQQVPLTNFLVLNSLSFLDTAFPILDRHRKQHLYWDRGIAGTRATQRAQARGPGYIDHSDLYRGYDDLNEWHCKIGTPPGQRLLLTSHRKLHI